MGHRSQTLVRVGMNSMIFADPLQLGLFYGFTYLGIVPTEIRKHNFGRHHFILRASMGPIIVLISYKYFIFFFWKYSCWKRNYPPFIGRPDHVFLSSIMQDLYEQVPNRYLTHPKVNTLAPNSQRDMVSRS